MSDIIKIIIDKNHQITASDTVIGRIGENKVCDLELSFEDEIGDNWVFIDFEKPSGEKVKTSRLNVNDNIAYYTVTDDLINEFGILNIQIVLQNEKDVIWKSNVSPFFIQESINAVDDIPESEKQDFITEAQKLLEDIKQNGGGTITDVQVDGVSVVNNKVANITLRKMIIDILIEYKLIPEEDIDEFTISKLEELMVSYLENKTIEEVER